MMMTGDPIDGKTAERIGLIMQAVPADDLDADSLDLVELVMALEEEFDVTVEEEELEDIETVGAAFTMIEAKLG